MIAEWHQSWRRRRKLRAAEELMVWREQATLVAAAFTRALRQSGPDAPSDVVLNRLDWGLEHLRRLSTAVHRPLARHDQELALQLETCLTQAYELRNQTLSYLIRWESYRQADHEAGRGAFTARRQAQDMRRERDEALLPALQILRRLNAALAEVSPRLQAVAYDWALSQRPPSLAG